MSRDEFIQGVGGRKKAASILGAGCLLPILLICGLLFGGIGWIGSQFSVAHSNPPVWGRYAPYESPTEAARDCDEYEYVLELWRGGWACAKDY